MNDFTFGLILGLLIGAALVLLFDVLCDVPLVELFDKAITKLFGGNDDND